MPRYKLLAIDLDGTLLNSATKLSEGNAKAVAKARDAGVAVVLATSRWFGLAKRTSDRLGLTAPIICSNGAEVRQQDGKTILHLPLDAEAAREVVTWGDDHGWEMFTTLGDVTYMNMRPGIIPERLPGGLRVTERQSDHLDEGTPVTVQVWQEEAVREVGERFVPKFAESVRFSFNTPVGLPHYVVLANSEAEKANALRRVCEELSIAPEETVAIGDSESDIEMLRFAGLGIAVRNSPDEVKRDALHVAPSNDEDGVAWAIHKFII